MVAGAQARYSIADTNSVFLLAHIPFLLTDTAVLLFKAISAFTTTYKAYLFVLFKRPGMEPVRGIPAVDVIHHSCKLKSQARKNTMDLCM